MRTQDGQAWPFPESERPALGQQEPEQPRQQGDARQPVQPVESKQLATPRKGWRGLTPPPASFFYLLHEDMMVRLLLSCWLLPFDCLYHNSPNHFVIKSKLEG